ncbi:uncharacterized protein LOC125657755 isoform X4 [Ostrea edulis]|uniref:uncharacterized protein LOC125657755 isoform X4 n=1 Tax=Ostrea edulis TaxID=37623 RepID=UPI0024AFAB26|nr:uncharacterized protein LOC125657755 isoform X4 [Ostrea edulis]
MANKQVWFSLPCDPGIEEDSESELLTRSAEGQISVSSLTQQTSLSSLTQQTSLSSLTQQTSVSSLTQQTSRPREINRLNYYPTVNPSPVPRLNLNPKKTTHTIHHFNLSARNSLSAHSDQLSQISISGLDSASLLQFSLDSESSALRELPEGLESVKGTDSCHGNEVNVIYTTNNMENNGRSSVDSGAMNQTGSTNDSHHVDSCQASPLRGLSSDEGSGWKSETTETSEGNLSLSQYAIGGDHSEDDSPHNSAPEEFLTSAISEVSKDFISGNFSPSKYPGACGESDSLSDGDNHGHVSGAVYARYPESATGMSDCDWNPYATESDTNHTPRSNVSEGIPVSAIVTSTAQMKDFDSTNRGDKLDEIYAQQLSTNNSAVKRHSPSSPSAKSTDSGNGSVKSSKEEETTHLLPSASYLLYSSHTKDSQGNLPERIPTSERDSIVRPSMGSSNSDLQRYGSYPFVPSSYEVSTSKSQMSQKSDSRLEPLGSLSEDCVYAQRTASPDPVREAVSRQSSDSRPTDSGEYLPVDERKKLLGYLQSRDLPVGRPSDSGSKSQEVRPTEPKEISDRGLSQNLNEDALSQRMSKLLNSANELGSSLHQSLYNKEALGLTDREDFPKYKFSPVRSQYTGLSTPSPTMGNSAQEDLTRSAKSMASDVSLRSSLGEEVAKLLARTENLSANKPNDDVSAASEPSSQTFKPIPIETNSMVEPGSRKENIAVDGHSRHGSEDSQKSEDSLDRKVKEILQRTSYVEKKQVPRKVEPSALDYSLLQKDLQEIQNSLPVHLNPDTSLDVTGEKEALGDSLKFSEKSFVSEAESAQSGGKKLLWDHGADLGYDDSGRFLGTAKSDTETLEASPGTADKSFESSGKSSQRSKDDSSEKGGDSSDVVSDQLEVEIDEIRIGNVAPDVEEIIARYQKKSGPPPMEPQFEEDTTGLANRVFEILTREPPQKQATGILEKVVKEERKLIQKMAELPKLDSSYDGYNLRSADSSFNPNDKDIRKQLEWSALSSLDFGHPDKTGISEVSLKTGIPFNALGNAQTFLSSQLQKMSDQTFNHSIELRTPYRNVLECYTVYGMEKDEKGESREAWPPEEKQERRSEADKGKQPSEDRSRREVDPLSNQRFFLNSLDTTPVELRPRRYSDPRDLSPEGRGTREGHTRSKSEDSPSVFPSSDLQIGRDRSRPQTSASGTGGARPKDFSSSKRAEGNFDSTPPDTSPGSGVMSPGDSDISSSSMSRRREGPKLRPYRPAGSREVYYTETDDSVADSITTVESTHTGSDDAVGPYIPSQHLGTRQDGPKSSGIYGNRSNTDVVEDALSTIEEKSVSDDRERSMGDLANPTSDFYKRDSGLEHSSKGPIVSDRAPSAGSDHYSHRSGSSRASDYLTSRNLTNGSQEDRPRSSEGRQNVDNFYEDSGMSMTTRSDPGDQFATPRRVRDVSKISGLQAHGSSRENSIDNIVKSRSRSETDLVTLSPEGKQISSSPATHGRLMDFSAQPSPILSHHNSLISPAFQGAARQLREAERIPGQGFGAEPKDFPSNADERKMPSYREIDRRLVDRDVPYMSRNPVDDEYSRRADIPSRQPLDDEYSRRADIPSRRPLDDEYSRRADIPSRRPLDDEYSRRADIPSRRPLDDEYSRRADIPSRRPLDDEYSRRADIPNRRPLDDEYSRRADIPSRRPLEELRVEYGSRRSGDDMMGKRVDNEERRPFEEGRRSGDRELLNEEMQRRNPVESIPLSDNRTEARESQLEYVRARPQEEEIYSYDKKEDKPDRATPNQYDRLGDIIQQYQNRPLEPGRESLDYDSRPRSTEPGRGGYTVSSAPVSSLYNPARGNPTDSRSGRQQDLNIPRTSVYSRSLEDDKAPSDRLQDLDIPQTSAYSRPMETLYSSRPVESVSNDYSALDRPRSYDSRPLESGANLYQSRAPRESSGFHSGQSDNDKEYSKRISPLEPGHGLESRPLEKGDDLPYSNGKEKNLARPLEPGSGLESRPLETGSNIPYSSGTSIYKHNSASELEPYKSSVDLEMRTRQPLATLRDDVSAERQRQRADSQEYIERERGRPLDRGQDYLDVFIPQAIDREIRSRDRSNERRSEGQRSRERTPERLNRSRSPTSRSRSPANRSRSPANRSSERELREYLVDGEIFTELPRVPDDEFEDMVRTERLKAKKELELMRQMKRPKGSILTEEDEKEFGAEFDSIPPSKKAQALRDTLERERDHSIPSNINDLWRKFQEMNETQSDSSMNTSRIETLTSLLQNPTKHAVQRVLDDRTYQKAKERRVIQELVDMESGNQEKKRENQPREVETRRIEKQKKRQTLSEEEINGSYAEILTKQKKRVETEKKQKNKENKLKGSKSLRIQEVKKLGDSADTLYSIPEDTSFESSRGASPNVVTESQKKAKRQRQKNVIDPLMVKLRDKVEKQKNKIDVERRKEMKRLEKLKRLEMLLGAKKKGKLSDKAIFAELENVSSTSVPQSDDSTTFLNSDSTLMEDSGDSNVPVLDSTSSKDSSIELQRTRVRKSRDNREFQKSSLSAAAALDDSESQSDIIVVRKPRTKEKKDRLNDEAGHRSRGHKKNRGRESPKHKYHDTDLSPSREKFHLETSPVRTRKLRDIGTMYPSPIVVSPTTMRRRPREVAMKSEAVQTVGRTASPSYSETRVIPVPMMSPESQRRSRISQPFRGDKHHSMQSSSPESSPNRSNLFPRSYTPPRSKSPPSRSSIQQRVRPASSGSQSVTPQRNRSTSPPKSRMFVPESDSEYEKFVMKTPPKNKMFTPETPDDEYTAKMRDSPKGLAWYIAMDKEVKPWRKPLREQQAHAVRKEPWKPNNVSSTQWKNMVNSDIMNKSRDTKFDLNPEGELIDKENSMDDTEEDLSDSKPLNKMSLQEAFKLYKSNTISHVRQRQKRVAFAAEERRLVTTLEAERERLFAEQRKKEANPDAHPYSENLHFPKKRSLTKQEIKDRTAKSYKKLAEVVNKKKEVKRQEDYALNRLKAKVFNRRIQRHALKKSSTFR